MKNKRIIIILTIVSTLLLIPFIAMQFTGEVNWSSFDFVIMGMLLLGTGLMCEFVLRKVTTRGKGMALCALIVGVFLLVWAELAVGLFGTPFAV